MIGERGVTGRGVGTAAISLLCDVAFKRLGLHTIYAYVLSEHPRAWRSFEKAGVRLEGMLVEDRWFDERFIDIHLLAQARGMTFGLEITSVTLHAIRITSGANLPVLRSDR